MLAVEPQRSGIGDVESPHREYRYVGVDGHETGIATICHWCAWIGKGGLGGGVVQAFAIWLKHVQ